jgi:hypothetical protein
MSQPERWQLGGNAPEVYETQLVPRSSGHGHLCSRLKRRFVWESKCSMWHAGQEW